MNFYEAIVKFKQKKVKEHNSTRALFPEADEKNPKGYIRDTFFEVNKNLGIRCDDREAYSIYFWEAEKGKAKLIFAVNMDISDVDGAINYIRRFLSDNYDVCGVNISEIREITTARFTQLGIRGEENDFIRRFRGDANELHIEFRNNHQYQVKEEMIPEENLSFDEAKEKAKQFMADPSFYEELERIYSEDNEKKFYGNPVHYKINASNIDVAMSLAKLLGHALKVNGRLNGSRINRVYDIRTGCYDEDDFRDMFDSASGNIVLLDLSGTDEEHGNYAGAYEDVINYMHNIVKKNHVKTLCIFVENMSHPGFASKLVAKVADDIDVIEIKEGCGSREEATEYIVNLAGEAGYEISEKEVTDILPDKKVFTVGETYEVYNKWFKNGLRNKIYKSYKYCACIEIKDEDKCSEPYDELQKMIGLSEIKKVVDEIIDSARIQKLRSTMGMDSYKTSLHMVFTGNPGSAKTTVARLVTQIFTKEGLLETGKYVECGRADLVGRYVGWTAKTVRSKFREANGGVLFIDEAYSLVDGSNSFGDEAINTIVQEMENHRDDVIVIFAGYPEKMKEFLDKNEGLRSRIAFHLDFPDYKAEELVDILKLMAANKGYKLNDEIEEKCLGIFDTAVKQKEFGNGRFARNLLEQAMMAQSRRITKEYKGKKVTRKALITLKAEDFEVNVSKKLQKDVKPRIGFAI